MGFLAWIVAVGVVSFGLPALAAWEWQRRQPRVQVTSPSNVRVVAERGEDVA